jgi:hypothetical protein
MPVFRSNKDIFVTGGEEVAERHWFDYEDVMYTPKITKWDYKRDLKIDDIDIWEAIYEDSWGLGIYAAHQPYAEFYMIKHVDYQRNIVLDTYYGAGAQDRIIKFMVENNIPVSMNQVWVEDSELWLYHPSDDKKIILA